MCQESGIRQLLELQEKLTKVAKGGKVKIKQSVGKTEEKQEKTV